MALKCRNKDFPCGGDQRQAADLDELQQGCCCFFSDTGFRRYKMTPRGRRWCRGFHHGTQVGGGGRVPLSFACFLRALGDDPATVVLPTPEGP
jgi:hypothetical protein